jgi:hypothetical protein
MAGSPPANPAAGRELPIRSGGGSGGGTAVGLDLGYVRSTFGTYRLALGARGGLTWRHAVWGVPGGALAVQALRFAAIAEPPARWFTQLATDAASGLPARYRWSGRLVRAACGLAGRPIPPAEVVTLRDPTPIALWLATTLASGATPHLQLYASSAVRLAEAAEAAGIDLAGAQLTLSGEPVTAARLATVRRTGLVAVPQFGSTEIGATLAYGCLTPEGPDDLHLFHDLVAMIHPGPLAVAAGVRAQTLLATSLHSRAPLLLLNASLGDEARLTEGGRCACPLGALGWTTLLAGVRSYEKVTGGGLNFLDLDLATVLEATLPRRFGGGPLDYQLVEDEDPAGRPELILRVDPRVGPLDPARVVQAFLDAVGAGGPTARIGGQTWQDAGIVRVERREPERTRGGKVVHLHRAGAGRPAVRSRA